MLFSKRSKSFSLGMISIIVLMVTILILSGCGDGKAPGKAQLERITRPADPVFQDIGKTVLPSVNTPDVK